MRKSLAGLRGGRALVAALVGIGALLLVLRAITHLYVDVLWFRTVEFTEVFWRRLAWEWGTRAVVAALAAGLAFFNFRVVASTLGSIQIRRRFANLEISEQLPTSYVRWTLLASAALFGLWFGAAVPSNTGVDTLVAFSAPLWGVAEPIFGKDVRFYVFTLPLLQRLVGLGLALTFLLFTVSVAGYSATGTVRMHKGRPEISEVPRKHLGLLIASGLLLTSARFALLRYELLLDGTSDVQGIFGYADAAARLPGLQGMVGITFVAALVFGWAALKRQLVAAIGSLTVVTLSWLVLVQLFPSFVQRFRVQPNELARETVHIERNLEFTRAGFGLTDIERKPFQYDNSATPNWDEAAQQLAGVPVWSRNALLTTFGEVEAQRAYYDFDDVVIDRYPSTDQGVELVALSVREVNESRIPEPSWQNLHLRELYLRGMGAVGVAATERSATGRPRMLLSDIPPRLVDETSAALTLDRPSVYFGARRHTYAVINPSAESFLAPENQPGVAGVDYPQGIQMASALRTLSLAWRFRDANLLFAAEVSAESRFVFRRRVHERLTTIAPFIRFPANPYPVVHEGRLIWIVDGYTDTSGYPLASRVVEFENRRPVNYIRNSVKATVDAVTGDVKLYAVDADEPILAAYRNAFPTLITPIDEMPEDLRAHLRYPSELLELQSLVLLLYHQETAFQFHRQEDLWAIPLELTDGDDPVLYRPDYAHIQLPGETEPEFLLSTVFVPAQRQNLNAMLMARSDPGRYGELLLFDIESEDLRGPRQVEALVEQDPTISEQFSLWRQSGSKVGLGHLYLVPVGSSLIYMEPVYLAAEEDAIPDLQRFIVSDGRRVVMAESIRGAIALLAGETLARAPSPTGEVTPASDEALRLLDEAEERLRQGDFAGFGERLTRLRQLLEGRVPAPGSN